MALPAYGLYDAAGRLVGTCRAADAPAAREVLRTLPPEDVARGKRVRLIR